MFKVRKYYFRVAIIILLILSGISCQTVAIKEEVIPLSVTPSTKKITNGQTIVIAVLSDEWEKAQLQWSISSKTLKSLGQLSSQNGPIIVYTAPASGEGEVIISISGTMDSIVGKADVPVTIASEANPLVAIFPQIRISLREEPKEDSAQVGWVERYSRLPVKDCVALISNSHSVSCADTENQSLIDGTTPFWIKVNVTDDLAGWLDGRLVVYEGPENILPLLFNFYIISDRNDLPFVYGRVVRSGGNLGDYLLRDYTLGMGNESNKLALVPSNTNVKILSQSEDWYWVLVVLPENDPPILRGSLPKLRIDESVEQVIQDYYTTVNNRNYTQAWSMLSDEFKTKNHNCAEDKNIICQDYLDWWNSIDHVSVDYIEITEQGLDTANVVTHLTYYKKELREKGGGRLSLVLRDGKWLVFQ